METFARRGNDNILKPKPVIPPLQGEDRTSAIVNVSRSRQISGNYPDIVDSETIFQPIHLASSIEDNRRMRDRHSSSSSGNIQTPERGTSSSPHDDTSRNGPEQSVTTPTQDQRRSESPAIDYRTIDNRTHHSSSTQPQTTDITSSRHIQTQDLNVGVVSRMDARHEALPDLLHSHVIPSQVPPHRHNSHRPQTHMVDPRGHHHQSHVRHHPRSHRDGHRSHHRSRRRSRSSSQSENEICKDGCLKCMAATTSFRWILVILSLLGVCCVVTGIVLAALHAAGNSFLFLAIMFIGLGVLLVVVVAVGWKCTPRGHEPLHALFSLGEFRRQRGTRRHHRHHSGRRNREGHWYGGVMYPEFQYRRPPPSYNVSMQDYQTQLALAQSQRDFYNDDDVPAEDYSLPSSPPPSYRSRASTVRTGIQITFPPVGDDYPNSRPPTYRSHISTSRSQAHPRPSLPRDESGGDGDVQGGDIAFDGPTDVPGNDAVFNGPESVSNTGTANIHQNSINDSSAGAISSTNPGAVTITITNNTSGDNSSSLDANKVQKILHSRQPSGNVANSANSENVLTDETLDQAVRQTLETLDSVTSSAQAGNTTTSQDGGENNQQSPDTDDDEYPMETPL